MKLRIVKMKAYFRAAKVCFVLLLLLKGNSVFPLSIVGTFIGFARSLSRRAKLLGASSLLSQVFVVGFGVVFRFGLSNGLRRCRNRSAAFGAVESSGNSRGCGA